jgi:hypothetical protein
MKLGEVCNKYLHDYSVPFTVAEQFIEELADAALEVRGIQKAEVPPELDAPRTDAPKRGDLVDATLDLAKAPGIKREARIDAILSYLAVQFSLNTETKRWREFAKFADNQYQEHGWAVDVFVQWLKSQKDFDIAYWSPQKMMEHYPRAFTKQTDEEQPVYKVIPRLEGVPRPANVPPPNIKRGTS